MNQDLRMLSEKEAELNLINNIHELKLGLSEDLIDLILTERKSKKD